MVHSSFIINYYLIDENNEYILDENGDKIIISTQSVEIDENYQAVGGQASTRRRFRTVQSFDVKSSEDQTDWHLIINQQTFVGRYPSQSAAISVLYGIMYQHSGHEDSFAFALEDMVNRGGSTIDPVGDNIMSQEITGGEFKAKIINFSRDVFVGDATVDFSANQVWLYEDATPLSQQTLVIDAASQEYSIPARYDHSYQSVFKVDKNFVPTFNQNTLAAIVIPALSANLSFPAATPVVGQPLTATVALTNYDSRIPVRYQWTWTEDPGGSATVVKTETTTYSSSSYTPTDTLNYRVAVDILYRSGSLSGTSTGVTDSETSAIAAQPFQWIQGPEILATGQQDVYNITPISGVDYEATDPVVFSFEWMKNGSPYGTDSASQALYGEGTYTADVTGQNTLNGQNYSGIIVTRNSIVVAPAAPDVAEIKLFTGLGPSGYDVTTNPPANTTLYAYAYDSNGDLITADVTYTGP